MLRRMRSRLMLGLEPLVLNHDLGPRDRTARDGRNRVSTPGTDSGVTSSRPVSGRGRWPCWAAPMGG